MKYNEENFTIRLLINKDEADQYEDLVRLCKELPGFEENPYLGKYEVVLGKREFKENYYIFVFINSSVVNRLKYYRLYLNNEEISITELYLIYKELMRISEDSNCNKEEVKIEDDSKKTKSIKRKYEKDIEKYFEKDIPNVTYSDIGGVECIIDEIREAVELPIKAERLFKYLGIKSHKGILLYGEPGCGKTLIAKAIANSMGATFAAVNASEISSKWYGETEAILKEIFYMAKERKPSIIFFDEIDSIGKERSGDESARTEDRVLNILLTLMDGIEDFEGVTVIGATNRVDILDSALVRSGRFDLKIEVKKPDEKGCLDIFDKLTRNKPISRYFNKEEFANKLIGCSGADIAFIVNEAAYNCLRRNFNIKRILNENVDPDIKRVSLCEEDFNKALLKII